MPINNWYNKLRSGGDKSRWLFGIEGQVVLPSQSDEEMEKETARKILRTVLDRIEGDASSYTAIDSYVNFDIQFEPIKV